MNPCFKAVCVVAMALGCGLTACASAGAPPAVAPATLTAAELSAPAAAPETEPTPARDEATAAPAPGKLVCRTTNRVDGTTELYLDWNGKVASGVLRRTAPSGMVYEQVVRAERYQGTIVVDEPECTDLASHAAMVVEQNGKLHMRVGAPGQAVTACE
jgi:hypothetical protein